MSQKAKKERAYRLETEKNDKGEVVRAQVVFEDEEASKADTKSRETQKTNQSSE